jgi:CoA:oxalate CoA-transferase
LEINRSELGPRVLDGVRVLDFTAVIAGSYCTRLMADLGAEVVKIEAPAGEILRMAGPMRGKVSALFSALNSGKLCVSMDLKRSEAVALCKRLLETHDVVVENYSPGVMHRLGLDYQTLKAVNPRIIMCSVSGYGQTGPEASRPAYAPIVQATSGYELVTQRSQPGHLRPLNMGLPVGDTSAALQAFGAIMAALYYRSNTGVGQYIDIAMQDTLLATMHKDFQTTFNGEMNDRHYGPLETRDGFVIVIPLNQHHFVDLMDIIGRADLLDDPRFATTTARIYNYDFLQDEIEHWTRTQTSAHAMAAFEACQLPCATYRGIRDLDGDPQLLHRRMLAAVNDAAGPLKVPNSPFLFSETHAAVRPQVARIGEHNYDVLTNHLGVTREEVAELERSGVIGPAPEC